jgi:hypothetical protein
MQIQNAKVQRGSVNCKDYIMSTIRAIFNYELGRIRKELAIVYSKVLPSNLPSGSEKNHEKRFVKIVSRTTVKSGPSEYKIILLTIIQ